MRRILRRMGPLLLVLLAGILLPEESISAKEPAAEKEVVFYTALGDSIANGYSGDEDTEIRSYPVLITEEVKRLSEKPVELKSYTKNGLTLTRLNQNILTAKETQESIKKADIITITIGSNDLMRQFRSVCQEILNNTQKFRTADEALGALQQGISDNPLLLVKVVGAIGSWDYASFEGEWITMMETIKELKKPEAQVVATTIYNPVVKKELPGTMNGVVEDIIGNLNQIMKDQSETYDYSVVDLLYSGVEELTQSDGLHPNQQGQELISYLVEDEIDMELAAGPLPDKEKEARLAAEDAKRIRMEKQKQLEEKKQKRRQTQFLVILCINILVIWLVVFLYRQKKRKKIGY